MTIFRWPGQNQPKAGRTFKGPVSWLLGRQLLAGLKWIAIYSFFGNKLDSKDWMRPEIIDRHARAPEDEIFWFDYLADSGDGQQSTYNIACLCLHDLWIPDANSSPDPRQVALAEGAENSFKLPRGEFLFVGGDTAYHIADYPTLAERFQGPFNWAYDDIFGTKTLPETRRPIYGIPANHDHYDALDGFNRQFRKPFNEEGGRGSRVIPGILSQPQLSLKGFERLQETSYVALKLPYDWWLWGLDVQGGRIDQRQAAFFLSICNTLLPQTSAAAETERKGPDKLIVMTPEPPIKFGKWAGEDEEIVKTYKKLGLESVFLQSGQGRLSRSQCRLDLSGDIHHYARYWGQGETDNSENTRSNYASVVAGGGGAFLHPSHTDVQEVAENQLYPSRKASHQIMTRRLLMPWNIWQGGYVWLAGALVALMTYFAAAIPESSWSIFKLIPDELRPLQNGDGSLLSRIQAALFIEPSPFTPSYYWDLAYALLLLALLTGSAIRIPAFFETAVRGSPANWIRIHYRFIGSHLALFAPIVFFIYWGTAGNPHPFLASLLVFLFLTVSLVSLIASRRYSNVLFERAKYHRVIRWDYTPLWILMVFAIFSACYGLWHYGMYSAAVVLTDTLAALILLLALGGLILLAAIVGGNLQDKAGKLRFAALGGWHCVLQVGLPFLLVAYNSWATIIMVTISVILVTLLVAWVMTRDSLDDDSFPHQERAARQLLGLWIAIGAAAMIVAGLGSPMEVTWGRLAVVLFLGGVLSCVWFGWYLAVALAFNGHNNEAGGGARCENYRHFIRFRLTPKSLTGYVIGIDQPAESLQEKRDGLKFRLVDVFRIGL